MKKKSLKLFCIAFGMLVLCIFATSCVKHCPSTHPYYCSSYNECCPYPYYAVGSGMCYELESTCIATGYYCIKCHRE